MQFRNIKNTEKMVKYVLETYPEARKSDKDLLIAVMSMCGIDLNSHERAQFKAMPSFESLTRCRRKLQERGEYLPPIQIARERQEKAQQYKQEVIEW